MILRWGILPGGQDQAFSRQTSLGQGMGSQILSWDVRFVLSVKRYDKNRYNINCDLPLLGKSVILLVVHTVHTQPSTGINTEAESKQSYTPLIESVNVRVLEQPHVEARLYEKIL